jgi:hypothetical protein
MMAKHRQERHKVSWAFQLRYIRYLIEYRLGRILRAYISRGKL